MSKRHKKQNLIGLDLFCGAGGMSLGAKKAGIDLKVAIDIDDQAIQTYQKNHRKSKTIQENIQFLQPNSLIDKQPFIIFGGPPCQGFSVSNKMTRNLDNPNNILFREFIRFIQILKPVWFVFENVEGFRQFDDGNFVRELLFEFERLGYNNIVYDVLDASDYGVPQNRKRFFMIGNTQGIELNLDETLHHNTPITVQDALSDLPHLTNGQREKKLAYKILPENDYVKKIRGKSQYAQQNFVSRNKDYVIERYKHIKPGQNWRAIPKELMTNYKNIKKCHSGIYKRLDPDKPSIVIANYRKNMLIHPFEDRGLSLREAARLQSFPDEFIFCGTLGSMQQQIGNAVPPLLAEAIFKKIVQYHND